jgi:hypothetical protein
MNKRDNWMEDHFKVGDPPKILRPEPDEDRGLRFWFFLSLLIIIPIGTVATAWWLGYLDPMIREVVRVERVQAPPVERPAPAPTKPRPVTRTPAPEPEAAPRTITSARASELNRIIMSRNSGLDLMGRDRGKAVVALDQAQRNLEIARERLAVLDNMRISSTDTRGQYEWRIAHNDTVAAAKNASADVTRHTDVINSFDRRMLKATEERDAAVAELTGAEIVD